MAAGDHNIETLIAQLDKLAIDGYNDRLSLLEVLDNLETPNESLADVTTVNATRTEDGRIHHSQCGISLSQETQAGQLSLRVILETEDLCDCLNGTEYSVGYGIDEVFYIWEHVQVARDLAQQNYGPKTAAKWAYKLQNVLPLSGLEFDGPDSLGDNYKTWAKTIIEQALDTHQKQVQKRRAALHENWDQTDGQFIVVTFWHYYPETCLLLENWGIAHSEEQGLLWCPAGDHGNISKSTRDNPVLEEAEYCPMSGMNKQLVAIAAALWQENETGPYHDITNAVQAARNLTR